jgi:transcriptional regulator GlxA family with amidase domain
LSGLSLRQLERAFRDKLQKSIHQHYLGLRLTQARRLLVETPLPIIEIAVTTGFRAASNFTRAFRNAYGMSPRDYQRTRLQQPEATGLKAKKGPRPA